jgi:hypothetical protein
MKRPTIIFALLSLCTLSFSQNPEKIVTEKNVSRILKTLSADAMMGRPAARPEHMEPATAFIEKEFRDIGLKPLKGLKGFRQEFEKESISLETIEITIDGTAIPTDKVIVLSDKPSIEITGKDDLRLLPYDTTVKDLTGTFFAKATQFLRDTVSTLMVVAPEYETAFSELEGFFANRFTNNRPFTKVLVIGKTAGTSYTLKASQKTARIRMTNVVGMLEGRTKPEELVVFSGHYDHLGVLAPLNGDSIANGADDDASGTTAVIELARYFKAAKKNNRTLIFVAFTAEEIGGYGSKYFSEQVDADKVVAMFNIEMIGKPSKWGQNTAFITGYERSDFGAILERNLAGTGFSFKPDPYPEQNLFYRSDNATLARLGVPAHTISTDQIDSDKLYHTVDDEFESMDLNNILAAIRAIALGAGTIVQGTDTPTRIDKATVR